MSARPRLRFMLDESVPRSVGRTLADAGHDVIYLHQATPAGSPDQMVCAAAEENDAILVALDGDMKQHASRQGIGKRRFRRLSLIKLSCREPRAAARVGAATTDRRIFIEIADSVIRVMR